MSEWSCVKTHFDSKAQRFSDVAYWWRSTLNFFFCQNSVFLRNCYHVVTIKTLNLNKRSLINKIESVKPHLVNLIFTVLAFTSTRLGVLYYQVI